MTRKTRGKSCAEKGLYWCARCQSLLPQCEFYKSKRATGVSSYCRRCSSTSAREWAIKHPERAEESTKRYHSTPRWKQVSRAWREANKGYLKESTYAWRKEHPEEWAQIAERSRAKNAEEIRARAPVYRNTRRQRGRIGWADREKMLAIYREARRLSKETGVAHHVDHIIPLKGDLVSGLHVEGNLQILTASENLRKHNRFVEEML